MAFGLTEAQVLDVSAEYEALRVERNLAYVEAEVGRGRSIANVAAFTIGAIRADYGRGKAPTDVECAAAVARGEAAKSAQATERRKALAESSAREAALRQEAEGRAAAARRTARLDALWASLSDAERAEATERAEARLQAESKALWSVLVRERAEGVPVDAGSIAVRSLLRAYRDEAVGERV